MTGYIRINRQARAVAILVCFAMLCPVSVRAEFGPLQLFEQGKISEARTAFLNDLQRALDSGNATSIWNALMALGWFEDELSNHREAIEYSNRALSTASLTKDPFMIGRSLCWLGWAYAGLGMYDLAIQLYENAIEIGAPDGKIKFVPVWGLALQEKGAILAKKGDLAGGRALLEKSYGFAVENGVDIGVAEGGSHLAEIALEQGQLEESERFAVSAVDAANRCRCSVYNRLRAESVLLKVMVRREAGRTGPASVGPNETSVTVEEGALGKDALTRRAQDLLEECKRLQQKRCIAEVLMIQSRMLPQDRFDERYQLALGAFEILSTADNELRGVAEAELGRVFLDGNKRDLAALYLKNGLKVEEELFRKVSAAHISTDVAALAAMEGDGQQRIRALLRASEDAKTSGALLVLLKTQRELSEAYKNLGFTTVAGEWARLGVDTAAKLRDRNQGLERARFDQIRLELLESAVELGAQVTDLSAEPIR